MAVSTAHALPTSSSEINLQKPSRVKDSVCLSLFIVSTQGASRMPREKIVILGVD